MPRSRVSYCIPTHGRTRLLLEALESGLAQTRLPDEIVVSDDLASEESRSLVEAFAAKTRIPVRYVHCTTGSGQAANMNNCLMTATGDLILLLHDDDLLLPRAVEAMARQLEENREVIGTYGKQMFVTDSGEELLGETEIANRLFFRDAAHAGIQSNALVSGIRQQFPNDGFMIRTNIARDVLYRPECGAATDFDFGIRLGKQGLFFYIDEFLTKYRNSAESVGRGAGLKTDDSAMQGMYILLHLLHDHPELKSEITDALKIFSPIGVRTAVNQGMLKEAVSWYFAPYHRARIVTPGGIRTGLLMAKSWLRKASGHTA
jgi:glycosyltransferase involved in cell wall biosynthesis